MRGEFSDESMKRRSLHSSEFVLNEIILSSFIGSRGSILLATAREFQMKSTNTMIAAALLLGLSGLSGCVNPVARETSFNDYVSENKKLEKHCGELFQQNKGLRSKLNKAEAKDAVSSFLPLDGIKETFPGYTSWEQLHLLRKDKGDKVFMAKLFQLYGYFVNHESTRGMKIHCRVEMASILTVCEENFPKATVQFFENMRVVTPSKSELSYATSKPKSVCRSKP
jgi:outer membrane murein-binding lipoprotein Lpp